MRTLRWVLCLSLILVPAVSGAAISVVQSKSDCTAANFTSTTCAFPSNVTAGNVIVACGANWNGNNMSGQAVTDSVSTNYAEVISSVTPSGVSIKTWFAYGVVNSSGANTLTQQPVGGVGWYGSWGIMELSGVDTSTPLDVDGLSSTGTSTSASDGITTSAADTIVLACVSHGNSGTISITHDSGGGWTSIGEVENYSNAPYAWEYQIFASAGSKTAGFTLGSSVGWVVQTISLKQASSSTPLNLYRRRINP